MCFNVRQVLSVRKATHHDEWCVFLRGTSGRIQDGDDVEGGRGSVTWRQLDGTATTSHDVQF